MAKRQFEETYERKELTDSPAGVVTASMAIRHFNKKYFGLWKVVVLGGFKMNHEDRTVTLKVTANSTSDAAVTNSCANCVELQHQIDDLKGAAKREGFTECGACEENIRLRAELAADNKVCRCGGCADRLEDGLAKAVPIETDGKQITLGGEPIEFVDTLDAEPTVDSVLEKTADFIEAVETDIDEKETPNEVLDEQRPEVVDEAWKTEEETDETSEKEK